MVYVFLEVEKTFDQVQINVLQWPMIKKGIRDVLVRSVMSLYGGARTRVRVVYRL